MQVPHEQVEPQEQFSVLELVAVPQVQVPHAQLEPQEQLPVCMLTSREFEAQVQVPQEQVEPQEQLGLYMFACCYSVIGGKRSSGVCVCIILRVLCEVLVFCSFLCWLWQAQAVPLYILSFER